MKKNSTEKCLECKGKAERYMLAEEKKYKVRWGWFCLKCQPHNNLGKYWEWTNEPT